MNKVSISLLCAVIAGASAQIPYPLNTYAPAFGYSQAGTPASTAKIFPAAAPAVFPSSYSLLAAPAYAGYATLPAAAAALPAVTLKTVDDDDVQIIDMDEIEAVETPAIRAIFPSFGGVRCANNFCFSAPAQLAETVKAESDDVVLTAPGAFTPTLYNPATAAYPFYNGALPTAAYPYAAPAFNTFNAGYYGNNYFGFNPYIATAPTAEAVTIESDEAAAIEGKPELRNIFPVFSALSGQTRGVGFPFARPDQVEVQVGQTGENFIVTSAETNLRFL
jgi:hypothetical protein